MIKRTLPQDLLRREEFITFVKRLAAAQARAEVRRVLDAAIDTKERSEASAHRRRRRGRKRPASDQPREDDGSPDGLLGTVGDTATCT